MKAFILLAFVGLLGFSCNPQAEKTAQTGPSDLQMKVNENIDLLINDFHNKKDTAVVTRILTDNYVRTFNGTKVVEKATDLYPKSVKPFMDGFPDMTITSLSRDFGEKEVTVMWEFNGTNTGTFNGNPPTNKKVKVTGITRILYDDSGKISQEDVFVDLSGIYTQLGYTMTPPAS